MVGLGGGVVGCMCSQWVDVQRHILNPMSKLFLSGALRPGEEVRVEAEDVPEPAPLGELCRALLWYCSERGACWLT